jgi:hypothetical protein
MRVFRKIARRWGAADRRGGALLLLLVPSACTFEPGTWFATMSPSLTASYQPRPDRDAGSGWQKLNHDYQVLVTRAHLELDDIALLGAVGGAATQFDPADPPPGYTLCHNGHCHSAEGRLVPYAEIEAQVAGGPGGGLQAVVTLPMDDSFDLLAPVDRRLSCKPSCNLDRIRILRAEAPIRRLILEGKVRDSRTPPRLPETAFRWEARPVSTGETTLTAEVDLPADRDHPPAVALGLHIDMGATLFDGVEFAGPTAPSPAVLDLGATANPAADERIRMNLRERSLFRASVSRSGP